jgi:hypothetical protein
MKKYYLIIIIYFIRLSCFSQDTLQMHISNMSAYEVFKNKKGEALSESVINIAEIKNLKIKLAHLTKDKDTIARAIIFDIRGGDLKIHLIPYRIINFLDMDEIAPFIKNLKDIAANKNDKPYDNENTIFYTSRSGITAMCYMKKNRWKFGISTDTGNIDAMSYLNIEQLGELINILEDL